MAAAIKENTEKFQSIDRRKLTRSDDYLKEEQREQSAVFPKGHARKRRVCNVLIQTAPAQHY